MLLKPNVRANSSPHQDDKGLRRIKVAQFGLGVIGVETIKAIEAKPWAQVVGGVDVDPAKIGRSLMQVTGSESLSNSLVYGTFEELMSEQKPDVVLHTAGSSAAISFDQIEPMIRAGLSVVSSCEQLLYPQLREPERSKEIHSLCIKHGAGVVGTGVNPGFVMDVLPICLTGVCRSVQNIYAERVVNASTRRMQLQKKIGSGMEAKDFRNLFLAGKAGHAGFRESAALICHCMGWENPQISETCEPVIADQNIRTEFFAVPAGFTCGLHQVVKAHVDGELRLTMDLKMYLDAPDPHDAIKVTGSPNLSLLLDGGVSGDVATVAAIVNAVPRLIQAGPGLHLMTDLAVPSLR
jgi:4-hydroxy-tetrahydrodipicolinate reductase